MAARKPLCSRSDALCLAIVDLVVFGTATLKATSADRQRHLLAMAPRAFFMSLGECVKERRPPKPAISMPGTTGRCRKQPLLEVINSKRRSMNTASRVPPDLIMFSERRACSRRAKGSGNSTSHSSSASPQYQRSFRCGWKYRCPHRPRRKAAAGCGNRHRAAEGFRSTSEY
jgi:hypothetical protein